MFADLVEVLIGTGSRRSESLGLRCARVGLGWRVLFVRWMSCAIDNHHLSLTVPKTKGSLAWVALSDWITAARTPRPKRRTLASDDPEGGDVFHRAAGKPLHPWHDLNRFHTEFEPATR